MNLKRDNYFFYKSKDDVKQNMLRLNNWQNKKAWFVRKFNTKLLKKFRYILKLMRIIHVV